MNYLMIGRVIAYILLIEAGFMVPGVICSAYYGEMNIIACFGVSIAVILIVGGFILFLTRHAPQGSFYAREGFVTTGLTWIAMSALGALPFYISGEIPSYLDAFFETVSGFTSTGASIIPAVEDISKGLLLWRSTTHWIGGMGILVFLLSIIRLGGKNKGFAIHILRAESPGPTVDKITPRMRKTASSLYLIYLVLTIFNIIFLLAGGMSLFGSLCTAFGTAGTGGFGYLNDSLASCSPYIQYVTIVFMLLFSVNFSIYYLILLKHFKVAFGDEEFRMFWIMVAVATVVICANVMPLYNTFEEAFRNTAFTVSTVLSTTGFATADFNLWPAFSKAVLIFLMCCGACAGSTAGGMKQIRVLMLIKSLRRNVHKNTHPTEVRAVRINGRSLEEKTIENTYAYLTAYVAIFLLSFMIIALDGFDFETNISAVIATLNNIGPGFSMVGPTGNFAAFSALAKIVLSLDMLAGRLEIYPILLLFARSTWKAAR